MFHMFLLKTYKFQSEGEKKGGTFYNDDCLGESSTYNSIQSLV